MWQKIRKLLCWFGLHKWEKLPTDNYFKMELTPDGKLVIHKGSVMVDNVIPSISKCKYCNKVLVKTSPWEKGKVMDWWKGKEMTITEVLSCPVEGIRIRRENWHKRAYITLRFDWNCKVWYFDTPLGNRISLSANAILANNWEKVI